ncbi:rRNA maturation RNase YbeY [Elizabethkingia meningoseptica]|uniref:Endoribonuclease YbeY n=1 Tax=Elizabethkingia meningoseptica TaxID=238 RepID=A0A1T3I6A7_ELIME|nr:MULTISPECIES: rRNA maturation RNase YbeY [Elizabethkingia]AQX11833.1 rRNA maturation RNase YbeY [Elizabethkingia meningoseptica]MBG0513279.1 rRNA maturation RNase YbeY [Elizabethkingia meningoseptica]MDE5434634.1 rRNA maturation RNase YbeY [Elizabethkingia meningoseptica]MDE5472570.1 rRNA maturation RNase YbeY [Elizabethkingia meningoseptica]MDE5482818.1 rRNA maturation RNase YbeY [Elizabethkingia meningoseptica]
MINYFYENVSPISDEDKRAKWLEDLILDEGKKPGDINYILCDDEYLLEINKQYLDHDYYTDIITFDYCKGKIISGDIFLSLQRVLDNASMLETKQEEELNRVLAHGILHLCGYKDKTEEEQKLMRSKEDFYIGKY